VVNQLRSGAVEKSVDIHPKYSEWKKGYSKTPKVSMAVSIDENI